MHALQELQVDIADWHQIKRIRPTTHMRRTAVPDLSVDKVTRLILEVEQQHFKLLTALQN